MKILLINPPDDLEALLGEGASFISTFEPLGLLYMASFLAREGYPVEVIDAYAERLSLEALKERIIQASPDLVGLTSFTSNGAIVYELGKWTKRSLPDALVVLGNVHADVYAAQYLQNGCCDVVIHGEGEHSLLEVVRTLERGTRDFSAIAHASSMRNGDLVPNRDWGITPDLSSLPLPARDLVRQDLYNIPAISNLPYSGKGGKGKHMFTSRGCPNRCTFCVVHHGRRQRFNAVDRVVDEMALLVEKYGAGYIFIMDSLFISDKRRVTEICREIRNRGLSFKWGCEAHVRFIDRELVEAMQSAGCYDMAFGIESGVQRLLDGVKKKIRLDQVESAVRTVKRFSDIKVSGLFILGLPGETYQDSLQTIAFAKSLPLDMAQFSILTPYPGSEIFFDLRDKGLIDTGVRPDGTLDTSVWLRYSAYISYTDNEPIWVTPELTADQLKRLQKKAVRQFYWRPKQFWDQFKRVRVSELPSIIKAFVKTFF
ncbi:MAG: radical SAM protein [Thermodesulfobacteriota bacterium]